MKTWTCLLVLVVISAGCSKPEASLPAEANAIGAMDPPDVACEVVYLDKSAGLYVPIGPGLARGFLARELFRQALLISARDELGLVTRDAWLGDTIPSEGAIRPFDLATQPGSPPRLEVLRGFAASVKAIDAADFPVMTTPDHCLKRLWVEAEMLSRTSLAEILKRALGERQPRPWTPDLALPGGIEESLGEMSFLPQFKAARQIHDMMASQGQSPALLGALVRAYANLGVLTEFHWHPAHKVFKARAILYAQRWLARQPDSLPAQWHRAYAVALAGEHAEALEDLESAEKAWQAMAEKQRPPRPRWVALLDAYCRYDIDKLAAELDHPQHGQLAAIVHYHAVELAGNQRWALQTAATTLEKIPGCFRVHDGVCGFGGVSVGHLATVAPFQVLARSLYDQVQQMPGLPESVRAQAKRPAAEQAVFGRSAESMRPEFHVRARLIVALREASRPRTATEAEAKPVPNGEAGKPTSTGQGAKSSSRPADAGEPSWAALGHLVQEVSFVHVWRRADFERHALSVPAEDFLTLAAPLVADHPLRPFLDTLAWDVQKQREAMQRAARLVPDGLELHAVPILNSFIQFRVISGNPILKAMEEHRDGLTRDFVVAGRLLENDPKQLERCAKSLLCVSPHSPVARAWLVHVGSASKAQIAEWEKLAVKYPALAYALARHYAKAEQWDDAARCCQAAVKIVEDKDLYEFLADVYAKKGDDGRWLETLEAALRLPDYGLDHAMIQNKIARHFGEKKQWRRALPYATAAAESYSAWGLLCAAACYEGLQEWEKAEQYVRAMAERYRESSLEWYCFCRRTGHGDLQAARDLAKTYAEDRSAQDTRDARFHVAMFYVLDRQFDKALAFYRGAFAEQADPFLGLWVALLADELKDAKARDTALARIRTDGPSAVREGVGRVRKELIQLADWIERDLAQGGKGQIDLKAVEKLRAAMQKSGDLAVFELFLARYLQAHGKRNEAIHYWKERLASTDVASYFRTFAGAALCDLGLMPESYKALLEEAPKVDVEAKKQDNKESSKGGKPESAKPAAEPSHS